MMCQNGKQNITILKMNTLYNEKVAPRFEKKYNLSL